MNLGNSSILIATQPIKGRESLLQDSEGELMPFTVDDGLIAVIPEFPLFLFAPLFMLVTLIVVILRKWLRQEKPTTTNCKRDVIPRTR